MKLSILQWNIWCDEDVKNIADFLKINKADIICLQELTINYPKQSVVNTVEYISKQLNYQSYCKALPIESLAGGKLMLADGIFSHFPIINSKFFLTNPPKNSGSYSNEKRVYVETELKIGNEKLKVGTTHMSYTDRFEATTDKLRETDKLIKYISKNKSKFILTGDMNASPGSYTIDKLETILKNIGPEYSHKTWTTKPFSYNGFEEKQLNWRLDHIFATSDIKLVETKVLKTEYSDHLPILSKIEV